MVKLHTNLDVFKHVNSDAYDFERIPMKGEYLIATNSRTGLKVELEVVSVTHEFDFCVLELNIPTKYASYPKGLELDALIKNRYF